jgi:hypothetical protein
MLCTVQTVDSSTYISLKVKSLARVNAIRKNQQSHLRHSRHLAILLASRHPTVHRGIVPQIRNQILRTQLHRSIRRLLSMGRRPRLAFMRRILNIKHRQRGRQGPVGDIDITLAILDALFVDTRASSKTFSFIIGNTLICTHQSLTRQTLTPNSIHLYIHTFVFILQRPGSYPIKNSGTSPPVIS